MPDHYLTNEKLPGQPITVHVEDGHDLSGEYARSGWVESEPPIEAEPVEVPEPSKARRGTTPPVPATEAEPTAEQAPAELDPPKE